MHATPTDTPSAAPASFVLRGAQVLDAGGGFAAHDVLVEDGRVTAVERNCDNPGVRELDLAGSWLLPGVVDAHVHLTFSWLETLRLLDTPITEWALESAVNARRTLEGGVTTVRDAGGAERGLRAAVEAGIALGPRMQLSIVMLSQTGGHGDGFLRGAGHEMSLQYLMPDYPGRPPILVDGAEQMRSAVRQVIRAGGDWIKLCTTGGVLSPYDDPLAPQFSPEEVAVAVFEAGRRGRGVMAHAIGGEGIDVAIDAGVRSIEHGTLMTEAQAAKMAQTGCWLVPTLMAATDAAHWAQDGSLPADSGRKAEELSAHFGASVRMAKEHGVRIALGTDALSRAEHGRNLEELALLHRVGLTPEEALLAGTSGSAELLGIGHELGRIAPGYLFDAITLDEDPSDMTVFARPDCVSGVFKGGRPVVWSPRWGEAPTDGATGHALHERAGAA